MGQRRAGTHAWSEGAFPIELFVSDPPSSSSENQTRFWKEGLPSARRRPSYFDCSFAPGLLVLRSPAYRSDAHTHTKRMHPPEFKSHAACSLRFAFLRQPWCQPTRAPQRRSPRSGMNRSSQPVVLVGLPIVVAVQHRIKVQFAATRLSVFVPSST